MVNPDTFVSEFILAKSILVLWTRKFKALSCIRLGKFRTVLGQKYKNGLLRIADLQTLARENKIILKLIDDVNHFRNTAGRRSVTERCAPIIVYSHGQDSGDLILIRHEIGHIIAKYYW